MEFESLFERSSWKMQTSPTFSLLLEKKSCQPLVIQAYRVFPPLQILRLTGYDLPDGPVSVMVVFWKRPFDWQNSVGICCHKSTLKKFRKRSYWICLDKFIFCVDRGLDKRKEEIKAHHIRRTFSQVIFFHSCSKLGTSFHTLVVRLIALKFLFLYRSKK